MEHEKGHQGDAIGQAHQIHIMNGRSRAMLRHDDGISIGGDE
jgi:hypothetical protein